MKKPVIIISILTVVIILIILISGCLNSENPYNKKIGYKTVKSSGFMVDIPDFWNIKIQNYNYPSYGIDRIDSYGDSAEIISFVIESMEGDLNYSRMEKIVTDYVELTMTVAKLSTIAGRSEVEKGCRAECEDKVIRKYGFEALTKSEEAKKEANTCTSKCLEEAIGYTISDESVGDRIVKTVKIGKNEEFQANFIAFPKKCSDSNYVILLKYAVDYSQVKDKKVREIQNRIESSIKCVKEECSFESWNVQCDSDKDCKWLAKCCGDLVESEGLKNLAIKWMCGNEDRTKVVSGVCPTKLGDKPTKRCKCINNYCEDIK